LITAKVQLQTPFPKRAAERGCTTIDGLGVLVNQRRIGVHVLLVDVSTDRYHDHRGPRRNPAEYYGCT
jgi:shikimate 5-dehydrogenase